uniref:Clp R domain-containing protein n=1 Tax=Kalanchoe fedtschenkoi TaxID=63787 RepID=A0A7N0U047_KALFE
MRSGLATIQQTLTPEASTVLTHSISEAGRRNHSQVTPLHVAATLLASPSSFLRQACIRSHPNSSHPLQCRALELCFSVALDRLPMTQSGSDTEPPISNALMAALKRAQAHQRRGCPEQQQQPLLAVKVELEQLIISILDDPSVSRVMREATFSSPAVKAAIERSIGGSSSCVNSSNLSSSSATLGCFRPGPVPRNNNNNMYLNPRLQVGQPAQIQLGQQNVTLGGSQFGQQHKVDEVKRIIEIMSRNEKRNPVLVGDSELDSVMKQFFAKIDHNELNETLLQNAQVIHLENQMISDRSQLPEKINKLCELIFDKFTTGNNGGVILNLGDLKWMVEQPGNGGVPGWTAAQPVVCEVGRLAVEEVRKLLGRFGRKLWLVGTATCETYLRCQVYHNSMETDWDLQAVAIAAKAPPLPGPFPRLGTTGFMGDSFQPLTPMRNLTTGINGFPRPLSENLDPASKLTCCPQCRESYEKELANFMSREFEISSAETTSVAGKAPLPTWLQTAKTSDWQVQGKELEKSRKQKVEELTKKWNETCSHLHCSLNNIMLGPERLIKPSTPSMAGLLNPKLLNPKLVAQQHTFQPKLQAQRSFVETTLQLNPTLAPCQPLTGAEQAGPSPPTSPVRTELVLGRSASPEKNQNEAAKDFMSSDPQNNASIEMQANKLLSSLLDADWLKKLMKTLTDKVWWQREAAAAVATAVAQCKLGNGKQGGAGSKGNVWLLFTGPDRVGKKKMAAALSELVCGLCPVVISFGSHRSNENANASSRGKTALDRIGEAIRRNPFSVIMLEDIDEADMLIRGNIKRAMERGRIADSHGRELSLGNVTFILTSNWVPEDFKKSSKSHFHDENSLMAAAGENWQLKLTVTEKTGKRKPSWETDEEQDERCTRPRKDLNSALSFDLNEAVQDGADDDERANGSGNSSDLTADHDVEESGNVRARCSFINPATRELLANVDRAVAFDPVDFSSIRQRLASSITTSFNAIIRNNASASIQVKEEALQKMVGGVWVGQTTLEEWLEDVLVPSLQQLKTQLQCHDSERRMVVQLEVDNNASQLGHQKVHDWLPSSIRVAV